MARFIFSLTVEMMMLFLACIAVTITPGFGLDDAEAPSPTVIDVGLVPTSPHQAFPPEPYPGYYDYLDSCTANVPIEYGAEIVGALLKTNEASYNCCRKLIEMGKDCHDALVEAVALIDEYKSYASVLPQRGSELWNYCALFTAAPAYSS